MNDPPDAARQFEDALDREWLATNQRGGFASSTMLGLNTRRYHGLLIAAMLPPGRRMVILSRVEETVVQDGWPSALACNEYPGTVHPEGHRLLKAFDASPWPRWAYQGNGWTLQKELRLVRGENTVVLSYTLLGSKTPVQLQLRPLFALRPLHELMYQWNGQLDAHRAGDGQWRIGATSHTPEVFFAHAGDYDPDGHWYLNTIYRRERERGYSGLEDLWTPGIVHWTLRPGQSVHFACSTEPIQMPRILEAVERDREPMPRPRAIDNDDLDALLHAADQFVVHGRDRSTGIIAGYPWLPAAGREALIGFTGLLLAPGRLGEARGLLTAAAAQLRNGLLPTRLSTTAGPVYDGADVSLWFVHAVRQYLDYGGDESFVLRQLHPAITRIIDAYQSGTDLGIRIDTDGLLETRHPNIPTTWMNARVGGWIVTPRQGKPVELSALWYNALCIAADLDMRQGNTTRADDLLERARQTRAAFNATFWNPAVNGCYDVVDGAARDGALRPNQLLAISLSYPVLETDRHAALLETVRARLLTPVGLRTLAPGEAAYVGRYRGDVLSRDRAYHNGSVYPWLLGPYITAWLRIHGRGELARKTAGELLGPSLDLLRTGAARQLPELFDGDAPHRPDGCFASALSVGEVLRAYVEGVMDQSPATHGAGPRLPIATIVVPQRISPGAPRA